ncbi:MAG: SpoIIE family protein phosphatase [Rhodospirillales bacterium]|nr:SpoIIE family protein phosphatase [Rhodospirillales bacterium]
MSRDFTFSRNIEDSLNKALVRICNYLNAEGGALFLLDEIKNKLICRACFGPVDITGLELDPGHGIVGRSVEEGRGEIVRDVQKDPNFKGAVDKETGFTTRSILCAPMGVKEQRIGAIEVLNKHSDNGLFNTNDLNMLMALSASAGLAITNARMADELVEREKVQRELELAAEIQRYLIPDVPPEDYPVRGLNFPARTVSGDFFDFLTLDDGRICFCLGDVSGKGMAAALTMSKASSLFRSLSKTIPDPGHLLGYINREICETATQGRFVTMLVGLLEPWSGKLRMANAGHEPPLYQDKHGTYRDIPAEAPPVGIAADIVENDIFPVEEIYLDGGNLYIFTDGLTEGYLNNGEELGIDGLKALLDEKKDFPMQQSLEEILSLLNWEGVILRDDLTILAVQDFSASFKEAASEKQKTTTTSKDEIEDVDQDVGADWLVDLHFPSKASMLKLVRQTTLNVAGQCGCSDRIAQDVVIAVDEACQNIIRHAYGGGVGDVILSIRRSNGDIVLKLRDFAPTVDRTKIKPRALDDIRPGGLGTHFINEVMDRVRYLPPPEGETGNILRMMKQIA